MQMLKANRLHCCETDIYIWLAMSLQRLRDSRRSGVFSVRTEPSRTDRPDTSRAVTSPSSRRIAAPRLSPGNSYKHFDNARVGEGHVIAWAVTQPIKAISGMSDQGFIGETEASSGAVISQLWRCSRLETTSGKRILVRVQRLSVYGVNERKRCTARR
jgi:hypothetical protein